MRLALFQMGQETDTFNPSPTTFEDFERFGLYEGQEMLDNLRGNGTVGGFINVVEASDADIEIVPLSRGWAGAGGRITTEALRFFEDRLRETCSPPARSTGSPCTSTARVRPKASTMSKAAFSRSAARSSAKTCRSSSPSTTTPT